MFFGGFSLKCSKIGFGIAKGLGGGGGGGGGGGRYLMVVRGDVQVILPDRVTFWLV